jgi:putative phage-type endonuclease
MEQRTTEWFEARKNRVTGSNVGAILGLDPYRDADDVMRAMVRNALGAETEFTGNVATEWGNFHEAGAEMDFTMETGMSVAKCGFFPHLDWLGASPDGLVADDAIIEIKCPYRLRDGGDHRGIAEQPHYHAQIQIEMLCSERRKAYFWQWAPHATKLEVVNRDEDWLDTHIPILFEFYERLLKELADPDEHLQPKRKVLNTNRALHLAAEYDELQEAMDRAKEKQKEIMDELVQLSEGKNAQIGDKKLTLVKRAGSVSYAKAIKELAPDADLEKWRGKETEYWRLG